MSKPIGELRFNCVSNVNYRHKGKRFVWNMQIFNTKYTINAEKVVSLHENQSIQTT